MESLLEAHLAPTKHLYDIIDTDGNLCLSLREVWKQRLSLRKRFGVRLYQCMSCGCIFMKCIVLMYAVIIIIDFSKIPGCCCTKSAQGAPSHSSRHGLSEDKIQVYHTQMPIQDLCPRHRYVCMCACVCERESACVYTQAYHWSARWQYLCGRLVGGVAESVTNSYQYKLTPQGMKKEGKKSIVLVGDWSDDWLQLYWTHADSQTHTTGHEKRKKKIILLVRRPVWHKDARTHTTGRDDSILLVGDWSEWLETHELTPQPDGSHAVEVPGTCGKGVCVRVCVCGGGGVWKHMWQLFFVICDVTVSRVCHDAFICVTWFHVRDLTHSYACLDRIICVTITWVAWLIHMRDMTHLEAYYGSFTCVT